MTMTADAVDLVKYDPRWPELAIEEIHMLRGIFPEDRFPVIEHIGSTSIPGMDAKPILDILIVCKDIGEARSLIPRVLEQGYVYWDDNPDHNHLFFVKGLPPHGAGRTHHVHVHPIAHAAIDRTILFRDRLRANRQLAQQYQALKHRLADLHKNNREAYTIAKGAFIGQVIGSEGT
jgi:GrpB-like predicted nucleotidyltransferase (UPF0157 family)